MPAGATVYCTWATLFTALRISITCVMSVALIAHFVAVVAKRWPRVLYVVCAVLAVGPAP